MEVCVGRGAVRLVVAAVVAVPALVTTSTHGAMGAEERKVATPVETATIETGGATFTMLRPRFGRAQP